MNDNSQGLNFQVGDKFPLPIKNQSDGGLFQVDANGMMFILQLSRTDVIAHEAFRTGAMELALYEEKGVLFLLYQIDGIFKEGWGDAPLVLATLAPEQLPTEESLKDSTMHLYLVDTTLQVLLAQRQVELNQKFHDLVKRYVTAQKKKPSSVESLTKKIQAVWAEKSSAQMREKAVALQKVPLNIAEHPVH